ncbi:MAG: hypothetical protein IT361_15050 [Gemmatimonadaceae bacterium]|nr:hypothetical protein [Gemmatimonadaceae bacterium]
MRFPLVALTLLAPVATAHAQAWSYPVFQTPVVEHREFNAGVADAGRGGTTLIIQWREALASRSQFTLEAGLVAPDVRGRSNLLALGAQYAFQLTRSTSEVPLDLLFTAGAGTALGDPVTLRLPVGINAGHRFELDGNTTLTPYVHPRLSLDFCGHCGDASGIGIDFDVGASWEVTSVLAIRGAAFFGGGDLFGRNGIGLSVAYRPPGLTGATR